MKPFYAYIRVSTTKQGEHGVSLTEQREAIKRYAARNEMEVTSWFEEQETAAKRGRPVFTQMLKLLKRGKARGVISHKIDRSARNLRDWADLGELIDRGTEVHFANESLDLHSRGGRLSADIQAVVAADFIRNLREETRKGFYGRIKQGLYPLPAPIGYVNVGKGKLKELDPVKAPLVRKAFELYASGRYTLETLVPELYRIGLRNRKGRMITRTGLSTLLNNPFYIGMIRLRKTGELFQGNHRPLISKSLFDQVQRMLRGKTHTKALKHEFAFRRLFSCARCASTLIGEHQKGHAYYRCHTANCPTTCAREEHIHAAVVQSLLPLRFSPRETAYFRARLETLNVQWAAQKEAHAEVLRLKVTQLKDRLNRVTDAYLDGALDKDMFERRKAALLHEHAALEEQLTNMTRPGNHVPARLAAFLELAETAYSAFNRMIGDEKRDLLQIVTSNRQVDGKNVVVMLSSAFAEVANRCQNTNGVPYKDIPRTWDRLLEKLWQQIQAPELALKLDRWFRRDKVLDEQVA